MSLKLAAQQALDALLRAGLGGTIQINQKAIDSAVGILRSALKQAEPVVPWYRQFCNCPKCNEGPKQTEPVVDGNTSDGYHTFNELYDFRMSYNAALFNEWAAQGKHVHKSYRHHDGELCFGGGYFVVVAVLPDGQISNHYKNEYWDLFNIVAVEKALFEFDGHTGADVLSRLKSYRPEPVQAEPVAWLVYTADGKSVYVTDNPSDITPSQRALPLFSTPQQAKPEWAGLTNKEIYDCWPRSNEPIAIARSIEAAFKDKNNGGA